MTRFNDNILTDCQDDQEWVLTDDYNAVVLRENLSPSQRERVSADDTIRLSEGGAA